MSEIIDHQQQPGGQVGRGPRLGAEVGKISLFLQFVEDVLRVAPDAIQLLDLPWRIVIAEFGAVRSTFIYTRIPKLPALIGTHDPLQPLREDCPARIFPGFQLQLTGGHLSCSHGGGSLQLNVRQLVNRVAHRTGELQVEQKPLPSNLLRIRRHDRATAGAKFAPVEPGLMITPATAGSFPSPFPIGTSSPCTLRGSDSPDTAASWRSPSAAGGSFVGLASKDRIASRLPAGYQTWQDGGIPIENHPVRHGSPHRHHVCAIHSECNTVSTERKNSRSLSSLMTDPMPNNSGIVGPFRNLSICEKHVHL